uniref:NADH dehydrogenase subunit 4L n=1 Tax=Echiniscus testudo TaxID=399800 RepID=A0A348BR61_ECHTS|nr:NADH dehydrogenase subunit 4L [Echiniscus testudo]
MMYLCFFCFLFFYLMYLKSYMIITIILNIEFYSMLMLFINMFNVNQNNNMGMLVIILLIFFSSESIMLLTFYIIMIRYHSKDYSVMNIH